MSYHRACVATKAVMQPLVTRGFAENKGRAYELTPAGKREAEKIIREGGDRKFVTYPGISIGSEVMIVSGR
jgi:predicted transcriptional regulator